MKLRYFQVYDEHGRTTSEGLQYWCEQAQRWLYVPSVRVSYKEEEGALEDEFRTY